MLRRRILGPAVALAAGLLLAACVPGGGVATPTPTELTEEQAYAAAEDAFRAYIDAVNAIDVADPSTFEPAFALTSGNQNALDRRQYSAWHADGWVKSGAVGLTLVEPQALDLQERSVRLSVCIDAAQASLTDDAGQSQINPDRPAIAPYTAVLVREADGAHFLLTDVVAREGDPLCT